MRQKGAIFRVQNEYSSVHPSVAPEEVLILCNPPYFVSLKEEAARSREGMSWGRFLHCCRLLQTAKANSEFPSRRRMAHLRMCMFKGVCVCGCICDCMVVPEYQRVVIDRTMGHTVCQGSVFNARAMSFSSQVSGLTELAVARTDKQVCMPRSDHTSISFLLLIRTHQTSTWEVYVALYVNFIYK